ncbi:hypothetical protein CMQ_7963 [Grosmannia clavigera kw1407]|uniref:Restriction of telomere capping protein 4 n=1 Tax=Grosmannia clavigera (strain kw1407 / UAMH 11150) TaxID=655863 RepID=F0XRX9_GROCL|nr:uncharacterized protein CMQ_7963 [Grosmannia clavigera kw1407]EFW99595.1 hypothetical protein CMQ_7963 [Grosmannia clavigera kw1407]
MAGPQRKPRLMSLSASASLFVSSTTAAKKRRTREPVAVDALPLSSSSSSDEQAEGDGGQRKGQAPKIGHASDSSASAGYSRRGDMGQTEFRPSAAPVRNARQSSQTGTGHRAMDLRQRSMGKRGTSTQDDDDSSISSRGSKRPRPAGAATVTRAFQPPSSQASSQGSQASGADPLFSRTRQHPPQVGYSRQPSFTSAGRGATSSFKKVHVHGSSDVDEISEPESRSTFIRPCKLSPETASLPKRFQLKKPAASEDEDDAATVSKAQFKWPVKSLARSPPPTKKVTGKKHADIPLGSTLESLKSRQKWRQRQRPTQTKERPRPSRLEEAKKALRKKDPAASSDSADDDENSARPAVFRMPAVCSTDEHASYNGGEPISSDEHASDSGDDSEETMAFESAVCPLCSAPMDEETLLALLPPDKGPGKVTTSAGSVRLQLMKFDEKMSFCAAHRQRTAKKTWTLRGYPDIDWDRLEGRIRKHGGHVQGVLEDRVPSHFRRLLQEQRLGGGSIGGDARDPSRGSTTSVPGYYGQRGLRIMSEAIVQRFSVVLRRQAVQDPLIAARGYLQFVQDVLVPELAVRLIMEDMGVGAEGARQILGESVAMGELMHEDVDVVTDGEDEDEALESGSDGG